MTSNGGEGSSITDGIVSDMDGTTATSDARLQLWVGRAAARGGCFGAAGNRQQVSFRREQS